MTIEIKKSIEQGFGGGGLYDILKQLQNMACLTQSKVYYVFKGGNNTTGESWETAYTTITAAITEQKRWRATQASAIQSVNTYIIIAPAEYDENITSLPFSCTMIGLGIPGTDKATELHPTSGSAIAGTVSGLRLINMRFEAAGAVDILDFNICNNVEILNCEIAPADGDVVNGLSTQNSGHLTIRNCKFATGLAVGMTRCLSFEGGGDNYIHNAIIENNILEGMDATGTGILIASNCNASETVIRNNIIKLSGAGKGIDDDSKNAICVGNYVFHVGGDAYDFNALLAAMNIDNNNGTVACEPKVNFGSQS